MTTDFKIPELGENIAQGDVTRVMVKVGDTITKDQSVIELETDKATIEVPSSVAGRVTDIKVKPGDKVKVGAVVLSVEDGGASGSGAAAPAAKPEAKPAEKASEKVVAMPAKQAKTEAPPPAPPPASPPKPSGGPAAPASPSVRRLAREIGVDVNEVQGNGAEGRISEEDVKEHARRILTSAGPALARGSAQPGGAVIPLPDFSKWGDVDRQPMSNIRRKTAEHLSHAWNTIPHVTQCDKADITPMEDLRTKFRKQVEKAGGNLTVTAVLVKVLAAAVKQFPEFNSSLDVAGNSIVYKKYVHVGVAVDTEYGLLVPVIRNADQKNIQQIAVELHQLSEKARSKKLTLDEMSGGSISLSNLGGVGGTYFTPIVNWPEVAILGVSRGIVEPKWTGEKFEPRQLLPLSLSYDHRVIDGANAMRFLRWVVEAIEQPFLLALLG